MNFVRELLHNVASINDLNTVPEEDIAGIHHETLPEERAQRHREGHDDLLHASAANEQPQATTSGDDRDRALLKEGNTPASEFETANETTNKHDDYPAIEMIDYHKIDNFVHTEERGRLMDHPRDDEHPEGRPNSIWEQIQRGEEYMKGRSDPHKAERMVRAPGEGAPAAGGHTSPPAPPGLNPRAVHGDHDVKTAPEVVRERAAARGYDVSGQ